jgi:hypothetical protein
VTEGPRDESLTPAEQRLAALLALLQSDLVRSRPGLVAAIMSRVRWQRLVRDVFDALGALASSVTQGLALFLGRSPGGRSGR